MDIFLMTKRMQTILVILLVLFSTMTHTAIAENNSYYKQRPLDVRVDRLERLQNPQKQLEFLQRLKQLRQENQQLRNLLDTQINEIRQLKQQQNELYQSVNRRLKSLELTTSPSISPVTTIIESEEITAMPSFSAEVRQEVVIPSASSSDNVLLQNQPTEQYMPIYKKKVMSQQQRADERRLYQQAYNQLRTQHYNRARELFIELIAQYSGGNYADIAQYWIAEASYAQQYYEQAIMDYQLLLNVYPLSPKRAEAELKMAYSFYELGNIEIARKTLNRLLTHYPDTTESGQARRLLKKL
jgi:tol-pal system protein YbgF